jgi:hypothetical protein
MGQSVTITKPKESPVIEFETEKGTYKRTATVLNHLMGEAIESAKQLEDSQTPRTIVTYECFRGKLATHLGIDVSDISEDVAFFIAVKQAELVDDLKKTCVSSADSQS